jgi:hypothetical protein
MTRDEARELLERCRDQDDREPFPVLTCMKRILESYPNDRVVFNEVIRTWLVSKDSKERFDGAWLTDELCLAENIDLVHELRDQAETREDPSARFDWMKFNEIAGRLTAKELRGHLKMLLHAPRESAAEPGARGAGTGGNLTPPLTCGFVGGPDRDRTDYPRHAMAVLYQVSYGPSI